VTEQRDDTAGQLIEPFGAVMAGTIALTGVL